MCQSFFKAEHDLSYSGWHANVLKSLDLTVPTADDAGDVSCAGYFAFLSLCL